MVSEIISHALLAFGTFRIALSQNDERDYLALHVWVAFSYCQETGWLARLSHLRYGPFAFFTWSEATMVSEIISHAFSALS